MPSVFETVSSLLGQGGNMKKLSMLVGADVDQTNSVVAIAAPAVLGGVADKAAEPGGISTVMSMLDGVDDATVGSLGGLLDTGEPQTGTKILDGIFGEDRDGLVGALTSQTGADRSTVTRVLPMLAPVVMGALRHRRSTDGLDRPAMMSLLAREKTELIENGSFDYGWMSKTPVGAAAVSAGVSTGVTGAMAGNGLGGEVGSGVGTATLAVGTAGADVANTEPGAVAVATETGRGSETAVGGSVSGTAGATSDAAGAVKSTGAGGPGGGGKKILPWIIGGLATVLVLAWALSQFGNDEASDPGTPIPNEEVAEVSSDDTVAEPVDTSEEAEAETGGIDVAAVQSDVDAALSAADVNGVTATVGDDGVVTLSGTVESVEVSTSAESAIAELDGVVEVSNQLVVEPAASSSDEEDANDEPVTINEELSLGPITFEVASTRITAEGQAVLDQAADYLNANPDVNVEIAGHTDTDGEDTANMVLSQARAVLVKSYLENKGVDGERMTPKGYGSSQPIASNDTLGGKARNRRIEFVIQ